MEQAEQIARLKLSGEIIDRLADVRKAEASRDRQRELFRAAEDDLNAADAALQEAYKARDAYEAKAAAAVLA